MLASPRKRLLVVLIFLALVFCIDLVYHLKTGKVRTDFKYHYQATRALLEGRDIYDVARVGLRFKYFPTNAVLFTIFGVWPVHIAQGLWFTFNLGLALVLFYLVYQLIRPVSSTGWFVAVILFASFIWVNLKQGQINFTVFFLTVAGLYYFFRGRDFGAGFVIGLAAVLKFMPIFFGGYFLWKRQWRVVCGLVVSLVFFLVVLPLIAMGPGYYFQMMQRYIAEGSQRVNQMAGSSGAYGQSVQVLVYALLHKVDKTMAFRKGPNYINLVELGHLPAKTIALSVSILWILLTMWVTRRGTPRDSTVVWLWEFCLVFTLMLLVTPEARKAHFLTLYFPYSVLIAVAAWAKARPEPGWQRRSRVLIGVLSGGYLLLLMRYTSLFGARFSTVALAYSVMGISSLILFLYLVINHPLARQIEHAQG
jgi:hypothetical protein